MPPEMGKVLRLPLLLLPVVIRRRNLAKKILLMSIVQSAYYRQACVRHFILYNLFSYVISGIKVLVL